MATTENTYTGNGSLTEYSFTFPYLEESDVRVSLDGVDQPTTAYSFANATTISFVTAPSNGVAIRIYRQTAQEAPPATFFAGSAIRASDLNDNFLQQLYVAQETDNIARNLTAGDIAPGAITNVQLADNAVTTTKISDSAVTTTKLASNLTIDLTSGTVGSPSLTFDSNTGLYSPGEDQVAISTGGNELLRITSQRVGIGTTSPGASLHVAGTGAIIRVSDGEQIDLIPGAIASDPSLILSSSGSALTFASNGASEQMRLDTSGKLGIGTDSPSEQLTVSSTNNTILSVSTGNSSAKVAVDNDRAANLVGGQVIGRWNGNDIARIDFYNGADGTNKDDGEISFSTSANGSNPQARMKITSTGDLSFDSGYGSVATAYGCRAWVNFDGTGTVAIRDSGNVSSITDNGIGDYTVNFATAMPDANYSVVASLSNTLGFNVAMGVMGTYPNTTYAPSTSSFRGIVKNSADTTVDEPYIHIAVFR